MSFQFALSLLLTSPLDSPVPLWPEVAWWSVSRVWTSPAALLSPAAAGWPCLNSCRSKSGWRNTPSETAWTTVWRCVQTDMLPEKMCYSTTLTCWEPLLLVIVPRMRGGGAMEPDTLEGWEGKKKRKRLNNKKRKWLKWRSALWVPLRWCV